MWSLWITQQNFEHSKTFYIDLFEDFSLKSKLLAVAIAIVVAVGVAMTATAAAVTVVTVLVEVVLSLQLKFFLKITLEHALHIYA